MPKPNGAEIRRIRQEAGLKPADLARLADIPAKTLWNIESVASPVSIERLHRIARALRIDVNELKAEPEAAPADVA